MSVTPDAFPGSGVAGASAALRPAKKSFDPILIAVFVGSILIYASRGFGEYLDRETAIFAYGGQQILNGTPPYASIFNVIGPLGHILAAPGAALARWAGFDDLLGMRITFLVISAMAVGVVYALGRAIFKSQWAALVSAAAFLSFERFMHYATAGPREKTAMVLFAALALLSAVRQRWVAAGAAAALATLTWQPAFVIAVAVVVAAVVPSGPRWRKIGKVLLGAVVPVSAILIYFIAEGSLRLFADGFLGVGLRSATSTFPGLLDRLLGIGDAVIRGGWFSAWVFTIGLIGMLGMTAWSILPSRAASRPDWEPMLALNVGFVLSLAWTIYDFQAAPDLLILVPFAAMGAGAIFHRSTRSRPIVTTRILALTVIAIVVVLTGFTARSTRLGLLAEQQRSVDVMLAQLPPNSDVMSIGGPQAMVLSRSTNPNPYLTFFAAPSLHLASRWPGGKLGFVNDLAADPPDLIAFRGSPQFNAPDALSTRLRTWIRDNYVAQGRAPGWRWLVHRDHAVEAEPIQGDLEGDSSDG